MPTSGKEQHGIVQAYQDIFLRTPQGQIVLKDLMKTSGLFVTAGLRENHELQHMNGTQDMVRRIIQVIGLSEEQVLAIALGHVEPISEGVENE